MRAAHSVTGRGVLLEVEPHPERLEPPAPPWQGLPCLERGCVADAAGERVSSEGFPVPVCAAHALEPAARAALIARRVRGGFAAADSAALLEELLRAHKGAALVSALTYQGFATERQACKLAGVEL